jgi:RHH-type proline utilization regulon transcriptional repressor/proline dehydrogenase/delta 1-pyrroline-5-carboxylate dehydrogenase
VGPLIDEDAHRRVTRYAKLAADEGAIVATREPVAGGRGWFCPASVVTGLPADSAILRDEIFGPLLAVERVRDVEDALERVEALPYGLTGGLFCRNPQTVKSVAARSPVGNLYVNRHITGAMVGRQPFGGNRLSGSGAKAGGPDYLLQFVEGRVVTENTLRHGLVV